jgi:phosphoribosylpyrophosphate synthetase
LWCSTSDVRVAPKTEITHLVGDVRDRPCLPVDDMTSTGGTIAESVEALIAAEARPEITVVATHGLLSKGREIFISDTVPPPLAGAMRRFRADESLGDLW